MSKDKVLKIEVVEGRDLVAMDSDGTSDPFVVCIVGNKQKKTKTIKNTLNPKWRIGSQSEVMSFKKVGPKVKEILVKCYDWDFMSTADRMGQFKVPMSLLEDGKEIEDWFELEPQKPGDPVSGKLRLRLHLVSSTGASNSDNKVKTPFLEVIKNKDLVRLEELLKSGADVNEADKRKETALHWAASMNDFSEDGITILNKLLQHPKTNVNFRNMDGNSPFHVFCKRCTAPDCSKTFDLFLQRGADVNIQNDLGETPMHQAVFNQTMNLFMIDMLLKNKANLNLGTKSGETPIHYAVRLGAPKLVTLLLRNGADISPKDNAPSTLDVAREGGFTKIVEILKETKEMVDWIDKVGMTKYKSVFLQNEFYLYLLPDVTREQWQKLIPDSKDRKQLYELIQQLQEQDPEKKLKEKRDNAEKKRQIRKQESYLRRQLVQSARKAVDLTKSGNHTVVEEAEKWEIDQSELVFAESLGSGASGEVFKGYYKEEEVAIKVLKSQNTAKEIEEFKKEFEILWAIRSPHIVHLFGAGIQKNKLIMVMEFCNRGSLYDVLRDESVVFDWDRFFQFAIEMVSAIKDLHNHKVLHRDLKTLNLLVTEDWQVKVCDFGLSRFDTSSNLATLNKCRGTYMYIAPEVYNCEKFTSRSDVYSIGIILWEMANRIVKGKYEKPYEEYKNLEFDFQILIQACMMNLRPTIPAETPEPLTELIRHTFLPDKDSRPDSPELYDKLIKLRDDYKANKEEWDKSVGRPLKTSSNS